MLTGSACLTGFWPGLAASHLLKGMVKAKSCCLVVEGVDHLDVEFGVFEGGVVEALDVVEEVAGEGGVGLDAVPGSRIRCRLQ